MKIKNLLIFMALIPMLLPAKTLTKNELETLGTRAFHQKAQSIRPEATQYALKYCDYLDQNGELAIAVLHFEKGFLIMSAEDAVLPVLAYDFENSIDINNSASGVNLFLNIYREEIATARRMQLPQSEKIKKAWEELRHPSERGDGAEIVVAPLLHSTWDQGKYYNYLCPQDENAPYGYDGHVPNGCVAVAMSQIMYYYRYPETGNGYHTNHTNYGNFYVNFAQQHYNYDAMCDQLDYYNNEVAKLIFHAGTASDMIYDADGSSSYLETELHGLFAYFRYNQNATIHTKNNYSNQEWHNLLINDLNAGHPISYQGFAIDGGHAFVCDGYDSDEYFHFNFGWGGSGDGFFVTESYDGTQEVAGGFFGQQAGIFNLYPPENNYPYYCQDKVITALNGTLEDGSGHLPYLNNTNCTYVITYPNQYAVNIDLQTLETEQGHDFLRFWDGHPSTNNLLAEYSGSGSYSGLQFETDSLYITFQSDHATTDQGWRLAYYSLRNAPGCDVNVYNTPTGDFSDNSGENNYNDNSDCSWTIRLSGGNAIVFTFDEFDISPEDHLDFYDINTTPNVLITSCSGNALPGPILCNTNRVRVRFVSDNYLNGQGFLGHWHTSGVGIEDRENPLSIYPNPASDFIHLSIPEDFDQCGVTIYNMVGETVFSQSYTLGQTMDIPVNQFVNGVYLITVNGNGRTIHKKIVIQH